MSLNHMARAFKHPMLAFREANKLSQAAAGELAKITQSQWSNLETRQSFASPEVASRIAELTGMDKDRLLNFGDSEPVDEMETVSGELTQNIKDMP